MSPSPIHILPFNAPFQNNIFTICHPHNPLFWVHIWQIRVGLVINIIKEMRDQQLHLWTWNRTLLVFVFFLSRIFPPSSPNPQPRAPFQRGSSDSVCFKELEFYAELLHPNFTHDRQFSIVSVFLRGRCQCSQDEK